MGTLKKTIQEILMSWESKTIIKIVGGNKADESYVRRTHEKENYKDLTRSIW